MKKILFVLTVDTEEEWDWRDPFPRDSFSTQNGLQIPKFQKFCANLGIKPTYFVDYAMADSPGSSEALLEAMATNGCEIAAHLHPWCTPPVVEEHTYENSYIINLAKDLLEKKLRNLTTKLEQTFNCRPRTFRSGRWGMDGRTLQLLAENGYVIDSSIYPYYQDFGFDYTAAQDTPYWPDFHLCTRPGKQRQIYEIPVSSGFSRGSFPRGQKIHTLLAGKPFASFHLLGILSRLGIFYKVQLSPEPATAEEMVSCAHACVNNGHMLLHMFLHSSSLIAGGNPYVPTKKSVSTIYDRIEHTVNILNGHYSLQNVTLQEAADILRP